MLSLVLNRVGVSVYRMASPGASAASSQALAANDPDFQIQGEYVGTIKISADESDIVPIGVQLVALGDREFRTTTYIGGLPGVGLDGVDRHDARGI